MRETKDSGIEWIGEIPADWNLKKLKHTFAISSGTTPKSDNLEYWDGDIPWVTPADYKTEDKYVYHGRKFLSEAGVNAANLQLLPVNSIIFSKRAPIGAVAITGAKLAINQGCISCVPAIECDIRYYYFILSIYTEQFNLLGSGTTFKEISSKDFGNFTVPVPSVSVQKKLADYLDRKCSRIDAVIARQQKVIEKLKAYKLSVITEAVTKGLNPDVPMKDSGIEWIGEIPEHWKIAKIKNYCQLKTGVTPSISNAEWFGGEVQWFTPGDFNESYRLSKSKRTLSRKALESNVAVIAPANTVMIIGIGTAGKVGLADVECSFNQQITALLANSVNPKFLMYWMIANTKFLRETALFTTLPILNNQTIGNYLLLCPANRIEEKQIVDFLDEKCNEIESTISAKENIIDKLVDYKKALIYEVVTGKKEV